MPYARRSIVSGWADAAGKVLGRGVGGLRDAGADATPPALRIPVPPTLPRQPDEARALDALADALGVGDGRPRVVTTPNGVSVAIRRELLRHTVRGATTGASGARGGWCRR